ncbi:hypothetical protein PG991_015526 [Apiospora marii]|uniref:Uncharacterized protein n=1 Tax=Apiospora marii TaxID=335849 RepID=A0ABR1R1X8_9PEZI
MRILLMPDFGQVTGLLATHPAAFEECGDIMHRRVPFQYSLTTTGMALGLPASQDEDIWIVLPCFIRGQMRRIIALPLVRLSSGLYARPDLPAMLVDHTRWSQWPIKQLDVVTYEVPSSGLSGVPQQSVWIRDLEDGRRITAFKWSSRLKRPEDNSTSRFDTFVLLFQDVATENKYALVLISWKPELQSIHRVRSLWVGGGVVSVQEEEDGWDVKKRIEQGQHGPLAWYYRLPDSVLLVRLEGGHFLGESTFHVDIVRLKYGMVASCIMALADIQLLIPKMMWIILGQSRLGYIAIEILEHVLLYSSLLRSPVVYGTSAVWMYGQIYSTLQYFGIDEPGYSALSRVILIFKPAVYHVLPVISLFRPSSSVLIRKWRFVTTVCLCFLIPTLGVRAPFFWTFIDYVFSFKLSIGNKAFVVLESKASIG